MSIETAETTRGGLRRMLNEFAGIRPGLNGGYHRPFTLGTFTYASDGAILVCVYRDLGFGVVTDDTRFQIGHSVFEDRVLEHFSGQALNTMPIQPLTVPPLFRICDQCGGWGCLDCRDGKVEEVQRFEIFGRTYSDHYIHRIARIPGGAQLAAPFGDGDQLRFVFHEGCGLLASLAS